MLYLAHWLAEQTASGVAGYTVGKLLESIASRVGARGPEAISRERAVEGAMWRIATAYPEKSGDLAVIGETELSAAAGWRIQVASQSGSSYVVTVRGTPNSRAVLTEIARTVLT